MKLHRFIGSFDVRLKEICSSDKDLIHQLKNVLKIRQGDKLILCDGNGNEATFSFSLKGSNACFNKESEASKAWIPKKKLTLCMAIAKKENFEIVAQKAAELGVSEIIPIISSRTVKKGVRMDRLLKITKEAAEQSGRGDVPKCSEPIAFSEAIFLEGKKVILHPEGANGKGIPQADTIFIGPEGGWTEEELSLAEESGVSKVCLGPMIMRAETAAIVASYLFSDIG